ncbi:carbamoyl phosphate synthase small subunit [bacterium LRH843]|nr:carbamoyl phosphate synthase small subunit [bacterium LRH843]
MKGYVVLESGEVFEGNLFGDGMDVHGEIVFYTGMTGYQGVISDPTMKGKIVVFTYPLVGNCGINESGFESANSHVGGIIISEVAEEGFHYESNSTLLSYCQKVSLPVLSGIDTRAIVKRIRKHGEMRAILTTDPKKVDFDHFSPIGMQDVVPLVSESMIQTYGSGDHHIVMVDFGYRKSILEMLLKQGCKVTIVPHSTSYAEIKQLLPSGVLFTNGPGNPMQLKEQLNEMKKVAENFPTLGIGLGHQLLALAFGAKTEKLSFGHRGPNQPVIDKQTNKVYMTSQNHNYIVKEETLAGTGFEPRFININDQSIEGLSHTKYPVFTTQFHSVASPGPSDSEQLFLTFIETLKNKGREKVYA